MSDSPPTEQELKEILNRHVYTGKEGTSSYDPDVWDLVAKVRRLQQENETNERIQYEVSKVYYELTGGRFSKPNTRAEFVIEAAEQWFESLAKDGHRTREWLSAHSSQKEENR